VKGKSWLKSSFLTVRDPAPKGTEILGKRILVDGGCSVELVNGAVGPVAIIRDTKGELHVAFSSDDGFPLVDITGPEGSPIAVQEYDTDSETTNPVTPAEHGSAFNKPVGPIHVTLYERE